ncbi:fibrinogen-binding adhesin SdrG C-terminal domain-containing protein [Staphylococcus aureus]|uniref:fibrinogen-binding adhesin SdrG C-terminal domain-containing protein n=1 Tax=Staphylococcus aureus TaxID=1280 RepID=UPI0021CF7258|nr:fibrinogen-binding adhesin SdrG C-terminal domain-containing protein [Staphylococcus aureus]UXT08454.1 fibrinogen-binding adhesin SdrG C-terminal domain-containing protein [Staphylococcus aureus]
MFTKKEKYSIRKFTVGAASIVVGSFMYGATSNNEASASEQEEQISKMGAETKSQLEQAPKVVGEKTKQKSEAVNNEIYTDQPLKEQKPEVIQNKPEPVQAPEEQKVDVEKPLPSNQKTNDTKVNTSNTAQTKVSNIETTPKEYKIKGVKEKSETVGAKPQPRVQKANLKDEQKIEGKDVSSKVTVEETSKIVNPNQSTQVNVVNPHNGERMQLQYRWKFDKDIKPGDYFDFELSKNVNTHGISIKRKVPDIKNGSLVMAKGQVLDNGKIRYTFTDYIKDKVNVTASLNLNLYIDPKEVQNNGEQTITATLNSKIISTKVNIQYLDGVNHAGVGVNGSIGTIDKENSKFSHVAYINTQGSSITSAYVYGRITSGVKTNGQNPTIKIYEYIGEGNPAQSVYLDRENKLLWKDVTNEFKDKLTVSNGQYQLNFDKLDKRYAISYEGEYQNDAKDLNFQTHISGYPDYYSQYYAPATWNNELVFFQNDANGNGQNGPIIENNNFTFDEDTGNGGTHGQNNGNQEEIEENNIIDIIEDTTPEGESGQNNGNQEETEENNIIDIIEDTTPEGESGQNNGNQEETEENNIIDIIEDTTPEGESGQNNGNQEEIEENNIIDIIEDTTPEGESGQNNGNQEETEENNIIDIIEDTTPEGESGQNNGNQEETEENNIIDIIEDTTPEGESGQNNGNQEEIEENNIIDIIEDTTPEGESGQNNGNQEEIEENNIIDIIEDTTPEGMQGHNQGNQVTEEDESPMPVPPTLEPQPEPMENKGGSVSKTTDKTKMYKQMKELPNTGEETNKTSLFAGIFAILGSLVLFRRNRQSK